MKVLIVDDNLRFASAAEDYLSASGWIEVLASASSGEEALQRVDAECPDLVLTDLKMPGIDGFEVTREIRKRAPNSKIVVLSMLESPAYDDRARSEGAVGFLPKAKVSTDLLPLIARLFAARHEQSRSGTGGAQ